MADGAVRIGRGAIWSVVNSGFGQFLALAVFFVTARFVSPEDFGILATCLLIVELFKQVAIESFATAITARRDPGPGVFDTCFLAILATSAASALIAFLLADAVAALMANERVAEALRLISLLLLTTGLSRTHEAWMARQMRFKALALRSILSIAVGGGIGIAMAVNGFGLTSLIAQQLATAVVATVALWLACEWKPALRVDRAALRELWAYARHVGLTAFINFANTQGDIFFASYYLGAAATGIYNAAKRILLGINLVIVTALMRVALPAFADLRGDRERMTQSFLRAIAFTSTIMAPIFAGLIVVSPDVVAATMGPAWAEAGPILSLIAITAYFTSIGQYNQTILLVHDKPHWQTALTTVSGCSSIALFVIFARYGLHALAIGYTMRIILLFPLSAGAALRLLGIGMGTYLGRLLPTAVAAAVMALATLGFRSVSDIEDLFPRLLASIAVGAVAYVAALAVLRAGDIRDFYQFLRKVVHGA